MQEVEIPCGTAYGDTLSEDRASHETQKIPIIS